jgi:hypothetical protein
MSRRELPPFACARPSEGRGETVWPTVSAENCRQISAVRPVNVCCERDASSRSNQAPR